MDVVRGAAGYRRRVRPVLGDVRFSRVAKGRHRSRPPTAAIELSVDLPSDKTRTYPSVLPVWTRIVQSA